jgi:nitronate monooxygenase
VALEEGVPALSFIFEVPNPSMSGTAMGGGTVKLRQPRPSAGSYRAVRKQGGFILTQGAEACGHRGTFTCHSEQGFVGILTLLP